MDGTETTGERFIDDADGVTPAGCAAALDLPAQHQPQQEPPVPKYIVHASTSGVANPIAVTVECARRALRGKPRARQKRSSQSLAVRLVALVQLCFTYLFVRVLHFTNSEREKE
jgi:hypothetical protein